MRQKPSILIRQFDWIAFITILIIVVFGLIMLYSIALGSDDPTDFLNFKKQIIFIFISVISYLLIAFFIDFRFLHKVAFPLFIIGVLTLILLILFGKTIRGTTGWFSIGSFSVQPVEFIKIILVLFLAHYFTYKAKYIQHLKYLFLSASSVLLFVILVLFQPDFGSAVILLSLWLGLVLITGIKKSHLIAMVGAFLGSLAVLWLFIFQDYQKERVMVFLNPSIDPLGTGYNITQAIIAIGSGQWFGRGLSFGSQSKLKFLPEAQTDFIFAVLAEQLGLFGVLILLLLFGVLFWRLIAIARQMRDNFALYVLLGVIIILFVQIFINVGMNLGLLPVTGITLPLVSYGGSSLLATMILLGIVQSITMRR